MPGAVPGKCICQQWTGNMPIFTTQFPSYTRSQENVYSFCYVLNVCIPPYKFICWNSNAQGDGISRWGLWKVLGSWTGGLMNGLVFLQKETPQSSLAPKTANENSSLWLGRRPSLAEFNYVRVEFNYVSTLMAGFYLPELWGINVRCLNHPIYFGAGARLD